MDQFELHLQGLMIDLGLVICLGNKFDSHNSYPICLTSIGLNNRSKE